jgi:Fe-S cluster assembly protein SufD
MSEAAVNIQTTTETENGAPKDAVSLLEENYRSIADKLPGVELPQVRAWRDAAVAAFVEQGLPHRRIEEWKYTDLRSMIPEFSPVERIASDSADHPNSMPSMPDGYLAAFVNGKFHASISNIQTAAGVTLQPISEAFQKADQASRALAAMSLLEGNVVSAISSAFLTDGMLLSLAPGIKLDKPLNLVFLVTDDTPALFAVQNAVHVGEGAEVTLIESHMAHRSGQIFVTNHINVAPRAKLNHLRLVTGKTAKHLSTTSVEIATKGVYDPMHFVVDSALMREQGCIRFAGENASSTLAAAMLLTDNEHADITLTVDHAVPSCQSREYVKVVLDDTARAAFQGKVIVREGAQKTDGRQMAHGLMLSETAEFDAKPELEIYADDVKCNHGATSGALDEDMLFYLRSRGIPAQEAKMLLILAFVGEIFDYVEEEKTREALKTHAARWLSDKAQ